jgi:hypothetical protein
VLSVNHLSITGRNFNMAEEEEKNEKLAFVTKKVLVTFHQQICFMVGGNAVYSAAAVCEYQQEVRDREFTSALPCEFTVVSLPNGPKLTKSLQLRTNGYGAVSAMVELD